MNFTKIKTKEGLNLEKVISRSKPPQIIDPKLYKKITADGYEIKKMSEITDEAGSFTLFFSGTTAGYYNSNPNPYDGLTVLHYGQAKKFKIYSDIDISKCYSPRRPWPALPGMVCSFAKIIIK